METLAPWRILFLTFAILCVFYNGVNGKASDEKIDMILKTLNKPALKTIKNEEDGDIIDCVDIYKQPAFDHPALKDHKIQMKPSVELFSKKANSPENNNFSEPIISQLWTEFGQCPEGTIPIRRVSREDISRASSPSEFGRKTPRVYNFLDKAYQHKSNINSTAENYSRIKDRTEVVLLEVGENYIGAQSDINVWNPWAVEPSDYSSAQIWLLAGVADVFESIEAGWVVNPKIFGDRRTRLFTYWTNDAHRKTGCFNLLCSGFVQTSTHHALGAAIRPISTNSHKQYQMTVQIFWDLQGNWWLGVQDIVFGYWPARLFRSLQRRATAVQWGGEVYSPNMGNKPHTISPMGSGAWPSSLRGKACYHTNIRIKDYSLKLKYPPYLSQFSDEYKCYNSVIHKYEKEKEPFFFFGGPGRNPQCL